MDEMSARQQRALEEWGAANPAPRRVEPGGPKVAAGWYPRPDMTGTLGYWDGERWGEHVAPAPPAGSSAAVWTSGDSWGEVAGWVGAFVFPILGIVIGAMMISRKKDRGASMIVLSILMILIWGSLYVR